MKKLLALVLALVMTLGLATVSAGAASYTDASDIEYKEAVDVMSAIGVLQGDNGAFNPKGTLTREQGAKIITYMLLGKTAADALTTPSAPFADVAADRWSAGSIAYAVSQGIIAGVGNNQFNPAGELTNAAFAKMLLVALGYDADIEGLVGNDWMLKTASLVNKISLADGLGGVNYNAAITRDQAAQIGFNTLKATVVSYDKSRSVGTNGSSINTDLQATRSTEVDNADGDLASYKGGVATPYTQFCELNFPKLKLTVTDGNFGDPVDKWVYQGVSVGTYNNETASFTYTAATKEAAIKKDLSDFGNYDKDTAKLADGTTVVKTWINGQSADADTHGATLAALTKDGREVKVYVEDNYITAIVATDYFMGKVTKVDTAKEQLTITLLATDAAIPQAEVTGLTTTKGYGKFVKDDLVMMTVTDTTGTQGVIDATNSTIRSVAAAETVTGIASTKDGSAKTITLAGTKYTAANQIVTANNVANFGVSAKYEAKLYLDPFGYVLYAKAGAAATSDKAVAVVDSYSGIVDGAIVFMIKGVTANGDTVVWNTTTYDYGPNGTNLENKVGNYTYTSSNDTYVVAAVTNTTYAESIADSSYVIFDTSSDEITTKTKTYSDGSTVAYINADTKFVYLDSNTSKVFDGPRAVAAGSDIWVAFKVVEGVKYATAVFVAATAPASANSTGDVVYVDGNSETPNGASVTKADGKTVNYSTYKAWINGEEVDGFFGTASKSDNFYNVKIDEETKAYVLDSVYAATEGKMAVMTNNRATACTPSIMTANSKDLDISGATIVDTTDLVNGIDNANDLSDTVKSGKAVVVDVMYDADTNVASQVFIRSITGYALEITTPASVTYSASTNAGAVIKITEVDREYAVANDTITLTLELTSLTGDTTGAAINMTSLAVTTAGGNTVGSLSPAASGEVFAAGSAVGDRATVTFKVTNMSNKITGITLTLSE